MQAFTGVMVVFCFVGIVFMLFMQLALYGYNDELLASCSAVTRFSVD